jgi:hypothetical protein
MDAYNSFFYGINGDINRILEKKIMNKKTWLLLFALLSVIPARADQLAYISKDQAKKARKEINKLDYAYPYCGCCEFRSKLKS